MILGILIPVGTWVYLVGSWLINRQPLLRTTKFSPLNELNMIKSRLKRSLNLIKYRGNNVYCPCCDKSFREFMTHRSRKNAKCPYCSSLERHRLLWLYLKHKTNLFADSLKVLHMAPEASFSPILQSQSNLDYLSNVTIDDYVQEIDKTQQYRYGIMDDEYIYLCHK